MSINFFKYQGTGNDFVIIDDRKNRLQLSQQQVFDICHRRFGIGADGLMLLQSAEGYDFKMVYYNADGKEGSMCGNGGRCLVQFANDIGIKKEKYLFIAVDGEHEANFGEHGWVQLKMKDVSSIEQHHGDSVLDTGSPHYVKPVMKLEGYDVVAKGKTIRYSDAFASKGINVNFVEQQNRKLLVRTYERGVEDETFSCGTGVTASALVFAHNDRGFNRVDIQTLGGNLAVEFDKIGEDSFENIWLCGPAKFVFKGEIDL
jgi:diaminopimelate epimerase